MIDWSDGSYERTARVLASVSDRALDALGVTPGERLLDLGCGTGNLALAAARRGARVRAVDPAARLVDVTLERAREAGIELDAVVGNAAAVPADDSSFDAVVSVFAVIFAPDADEAVSEMLRVVRPGGRVALTSWRPSGAVFDASVILRSAIPAPPPAPGAKPPAEWGDDAFLRALFEPRGASVRIEEDSLAFTAGSAEQWFDEQQDHHPVWRAVRGWLDAGAWASVRERSIAALGAKNEATDGAFRVTSRYAIAVATKA